MRNKYANIQRCAIKPKIYVEESKFKISINNTKHQSRTDVAYTDTASLPPSP